MSSRPLALSPRAGHDTGVKSRSFPLFPLYAFWALMTFEFDVFLSNTIGGPFYRLPMLLLPVLALGILSQGNKRAVYWPLIVFVLMHLGAAVFAENTGWARDGFKIMLYMLALFATSVCLLDSPAKVITVLKLYLLHFVWFGIQGIPSGLVKWHPTLGNEDSFGPLMVMAMPLAYFFALATSSRGWRWLARAAFFLSLLGLVASFARGAALTGGLVLLYILARSPRRIATLLGLLLVVILLLPVAGLFISVDEYIAEIKSSGDGDQGRLDVWGMAWTVFRHSPIYGVGAFNFGPTASQIIKPDATRTKGDDPAQLYTLWTHNAVMQILAEEGLIGILVWGTMLIGFLRRNARLRRSEARAQWAAHGGGTMDLKMVSLGLDGAMLGWLGCSIFYNQLYVHWFWSLVTISYVLATVVGRGAGAADEKATTR